MPDYEEILTFLAENPPKLAAERELHASLLELIAKGLRSGAADDEEAILRIDEIAQNEDAAERVRSRDVAAHRAPQDDDEFLHHQGEPDGHENVERMRQMIDPSQQDGFRQGRERPDDDRRHKECRPEIQAALGHVINEIGAQKIKCAMGEIHEMKQPEDDAQSHREQEVEHSQADAVHQLKQINHAGT